MLMVQIFPYKFIFNVPLMMIALVLASSTKNRQPKANAINGTETFITSTEDWQYLHHSSQGTRNRVEFPKSNQNSVNLANSGNLINH